MNHLKSYNLLRFVEISTRLFLTFSFVQGRRSRHQPVHGRRGDPLRLRLEPPDGSPGHGQSTQDRSEETG